MLKNSQDLKIEIAAQLQMHLNATVNLHSIPQYLSDLRGSDTSFSVIFKWNSDALQFDTSQKELVVALSKALPTNETIATSNYILTGFTQRAWIIGVWQMSQVAGTKAEGFSELRRKIDKFFLEPRRIDEGCDFL